MRSLSVVAVLACLVLIVPPVTAGYTYKVLDQTQRINKTVEDYGYVSFIVHRPSKVEPYIVVANTSIDPELVNYTTKGPGIFRATVFPDGTTHTLNLTAGNWTAYLWSDNEPIPEARIFNTGGHFFDKIVFEGVSPSKTVFMPQVVNTWVTCSGSS